MFEELTQFLMFFLTSPQNKQIDHVPKTLIDDYKNLNDDYKKSVSSRKSLVYGK